MKKKLHELMESRRGEMMEHAKGREVPDTNFGDTKRRDQRIKKKGVLNKVLNIFKK